MGSGRAGPKPRRRIRRVLILVLPVIALSIAGAAALQRWPRSPGRDPNRLGLLAAALVEFDAGRFDQARGILDRRTAEVAPIALDWMLRARVAEAQGRSEEALAHLKHIPDSDPIAAQAWLKAGQIERARHRARAAEAAYRRALTLNPDQIQSHRELAYLYAAQLRKEECDDQFRALARLMPLDYILAFAWSQNSCGLWDVPGARKILTDFLAEDPTDRTSRLALAINYVLTKRRDEAEATLRPLPDSDPDAHVVRAELAVELGDVEIADPLLRNGPADHPRLNTLRGRLALQVNDPKLAASWFRAALRAAPNDRDAIHGLGAALQRLGDPQAKEYLQLASRHDQLKRLIVQCSTTPRIDLKVFAQLGDLCESLGRLDQARVWYQVALAWDPLDSQAHKGLARLDATAPGTTADPKPREGRDLPPSSRPGENPVF